MFWLRTNKNYPVMATRRVFLVLCGFARLATRLWEISQRRQRFAFLPNPIGRLQICRRNSDCAKLLIPLLVCVQYFNARMHHVYSPVVLEPYLYSQLSRRFFLDLYSVIRSWPKGTRQLIKRKTPFPVIFSFYPCIHPLNPTKEAKPMENQTSKGRRSWSDTAPLRLRAASP